MPTWEPHSPVEVSPSSLRLQVLLLDEITVDMDVVGRLDLLAFFTEECEERGATIIYVSLRRARNVGFRVMWGRVGICGMWKRRRPQCDKGFDVMPCWLVRCWEVHQGMQGGGAPITSLLCKEASLAGS